MELTHLCLSVVLPTYFSDMYLFLIFALPHLSNDQYSINEGKEVLGMQKGNIYQHLGSIGLNACFQKILSKKSYIFPHSLSPLIISRNMLIEDSDMSCRKK